MLEAQRDTKVEKVKSKVKAGIETPFQILEDEIVTMDKKVVFSL